MPAARDAGGLYSDSTHIFMNKKLARELNGPSWTEVILGAVLSLGLGMALAAAFLVFKPVVTVRELPKEPAVGVVYHIDGSRGGSSARQASVKLSRFVQGENVAVIEDELNALTAPAAAARAGTEGAAVAAAMVTAGTPNFRIRDGVLQVAVPVDLKVAGIDRRIMVQARGGFERDGEVFVFNPNEVLVGSCPLQRLPAAQGMVMKRMWAALAVPEEVASAWRNLSTVTIDGSTLTLEM